jgi:glutamyl/glutaminyl-tRNA synthetase
VKKGKVIVRYAPSPTGNLHLGNTRTALFNYLFAKHQGGKFILRIDDTDKERSKVEYEKDILESLEWLGLKHDEIYKQSERSALYRENLEKLIEADKAYLAKEEKGEVIRFRNPGGRVAFTDLIRGEISFDVTELGDFVLARNLDSPVYHFASVVDDIASGITHVIRGEDHVSNTPRQILILEALGGARPAYAHIPLILAPDRSKLSKRHGAVATSEYRRQGYLAEALVNFLATLGWSAQSQQISEEIFSLDELAKLFDLSGIQKSGAVFNLEKLNWYNRHYLRTSPPPVGLERAWPELTARANTLGEVEALVAAGGEMDYIRLAPQPTVDLLKTTAHLPGVIEILTRLNDDDFEAEKLKAALWDYATAKGRGEVLWPLRVALSGRARSADPFTIAAILGKTETLERLNYAAALK